MRKIGEWLSMQRVKHTKTLLLFYIVIANVFLIVIAGAVFRSLHLPGTEGMSFLRMLFYTVAMMLDAGCMTFVLEDVKTASAFAASFCVVVIFGGMIAFTGALIGFITNLISAFIEDADNGMRRFRASNHTVILNWNTRASEIVNDLLFCDEKQKVVVLVGDGKEDVRREIKERLSGTIAEENHKIKETLKEARKKDEISYLAALKYWRRHRLRHTVNWIVREGDVFSVKQLNDISVKRASSVIILGSDIITMSACRFDLKERLESSQKGNSLTVKTLMQVAEMTAAADSYDKQVIVVETTDAWTYDLVEKIAEEKKKEGKNKIVPVRVNVVLGQLLSQFSLMPELNEIYSELFSNKDAAFYSRDITDSEKDTFIDDALRTRHHCIPLSFMEVGDGKEKKLCGYFVADVEKDYFYTDPTPMKDGPEVHMSGRYEPVEKTVIVLGHNSRIEEIMDGFINYMKEWQDSGVKLHIHVIDSGRYADDMAKYNAHADRELGGTGSLTADFFPAEIRERERISERIRSIVDANPHDTSVLILSDDNVARAEIDSDALTNLVYVQNIVRRKMNEDTDFDPDSIDVIVEIIDPKHHDVVHKYSRNNVVISNRYISKMITQISHKAELFEFYKDLLTYDAIDDESYESREVYVKEATRFFADGQIPGTCTEEYLVRRIWEESNDPNVFKTFRNPTLLLGYYRRKEGMHLFTGNIREKTVTLQADDKLIVYSLH